MAEASKAAVAAVKSGKADFLMKGLVATSTFLKAVLDKEAGLRTGRLLSHVAVVESPGYPKIVLITDGGMCVKPDLNAKMDIIGNAVDIARKMGIETPKVAVLAAVEVVNPEMPETADAAELAKMAERGQLKGCLVDGPLALDLALSEEAARHKKVKSAVAGDADILVAPEIAAGNILVKGLIYMGGARAAGLIAGAAKPVVMLSRADSKEQKLNSIALGVVSCYAGRGLTTDLEPAGRPVQAAAGREPRRRLFRGPRPDHPLLEHGGGADHGYAPGEVIGRPCYRDIMCHIDTEGRRTCEGNCPLDIALHAESTGLRRLYLRDKSGKRVPVDVKGAPIRDQVTGRVIGAVEIFRDATAYEEREKEARVIARLAATDPLTGLLNRRQLEIELELEVSRAQRLKLPLSVLFGDID